MTTTMPHLVYSSFDVLYKCSFSWWDCIHCIAFFVNMCRRVSSMLFKLLVRSYRRMVNCSIVATTPSLILLGSEVANNRAGVRSSNIFQISQAVFFPLVLKDDTVSHPVYAWNIGRALDLFGPSYAALFMSRNEFQVCSCSKSNPQLLDTNLEHGCDG